MSKHNVEIDRYNGTMEELVEDIGNLRYDKLAIFFNLLYHKVFKDGKKDFEAGREILGRKLTKLSLKILSTFRSVMKIWRLCKTA